MTIPILAILAFATWTLLLLFGSVGVYRWRRILTGGAKPNDLPVDRPDLTFSNGSSLLTIRSRLSVR